ncbi:hypothetical protein ACFV2H_41005 [Streptomyces sp. NPDC059629]|uniref:hypothetical protein n=1 Tax=Streptomyces sp. NPDC059629 TaxID=3346889 RepID=UPI00367D84D1
MTANREVRTTVGHPSVGPVTVDCDVLPDGDTELKIVIMTAAPGSEDETRTPAHQRRRPTGRHAQLIRPAHRPTGGQYASVLTSARTGGASRRWGWARRPGGSGRAVRRGTPTAVVRTRA